MEALNYNFAESFILIVHHVCQEKHIQMNLHAAANFLHLIILSVHLDQCLDHYFGHLGSLSTASLLHFLLIDHFSQYSHLVSFLY